nr:wall-associated kinase family protein [Ipomoea batatas]
MEDILEVLDEKLQILESEKMRIEEENLLFPNWWELLGLLVVAGKAVDPALNQNETELGVLVLSIPLQVLPDCYSLLNEVVEILWNLRSKPYTHSIHQATFYRQTKAP